MTIETKFNKGDEVWFMQNDFICKELTTGAVECSIKTNGNKVTEEIFYAVGGSKIIESSLFISKQDLLRDLTNRHDYIHEKSNAFEYVADSLGNNIKSITYDAKMEHWQVVYDNDLPSDFIKTDEIRTFLMTS